MDLSIYSIYIYNGSSCGCFNSFARWLPTHQCCMALRLLNSARCCTTQKVHRLWSWPWFAVNMKPRQLWSQQEQSSLHGMPGDAWFFSKASLSDFPIFPYFPHVRRVFWGNWQAGLRLFFWPIQGLTPKKFIQENWVPECLQDALEGRLESCQRVALLARGWVEMKFWGHVMWSCDLVGEFEHQQPFQQEMVHQWSIHFFHVFHSPPADDDPQKPFQKRGPLELTNHWRSDLATGFRISVRPQGAMVCSWLSHRKCRRMDAASMTSCHQLGQTTEKSWGFGWFMLIQGLAWSCQIFLKVQIHFLFSWGKHVTGFRPSWQMRALYINI